MSTLLPRRQAVVVFLSFAFAYFISALLRAITATLSPALTQEFSLQARDLGLLAGGYFLGFAATQLPLGAWLDRYGPRRVSLSFLSVAVLGCLAFSWASSFSGLMAARVLCGVGVSACLMAPLTGYRRWLGAHSQLRANSWMLMTGSLGMVASTLPVQWLLPWVGWRPLFVGLAILTALAVVLMAWQVPETDAPDPSSTQGAAGASYAEVWRHPYFRRMSPIGFFSYGGMVAMQTLWAGPWLVRVGGYSASEAATGLFIINLCMLCTFWTWGMVSPWLFSRGYTVNRLIAWGFPLSFLAIAIILIAGKDAPPLAWAFFCMSSTFVSLAQPAVGMAFPPHLAGRALSAYNLVVFVGVFTVQWGFGLLVDLFGAMGGSTESSFRGALGVFLLGSLLSYGYFMALKRHNGAPFSKP